MKSTTIIKNNSKSFKLSFAVIAIVSLMTSCTIDEIEPQPKNKILRETFLQRNDSIINDSIPNINSNTTNTVVIDPPVKGNTPPPPPNP